MAAPTESSLSCVEQGLEMQNETRKYPQITTSVDKRNRSEKVEKKKKKRHKIEKAQHITCFSTVDVRDLLRSIGQENVEKYIPM